MKERITPIWDYTELRRIAWEISKKNKGKYSEHHCNTIITFDIEASNGYRQPDNTVIGFDHDLSDKHPEYYGLASPKKQKEYGDIEPVGAMYVWQCAIDTIKGITVFMGSTWDEFAEFLTELTEDVALQANNRSSSLGYPARSLVLKALKKIKRPEIHIYIHNLPYEFQFLRNLYNDDFANYKKRPKVFARKSRSPMKASITSNFCKVTFHDTYSLTQKSLEKWGEDSNLPVQKLKEPKGFYDPIRTPETPLTDDEIKYCINDVVTMVYGMREYKKKYGGLENIVMTQTGEIRRKLKTSVSLLNPDWASKCSEFYKHLTFPVYRDLCSAFVGGWTHANAMYMGKILENIRCFDFRSSYPAVMCSCKFPTGTWEKATYEDMREEAKRDYSDRNYAYFIRAKFYNVKSRLHNTFWSSSKCVEGSLKFEGDGDGAVDNGKIFKCAEMEAIMTDLDFERFIRCYECDVTPVYVYKTQIEYLPKEMIMLILSYYGYKTSLKGDDSKASLYAESKQFINSIYGVMVYKEFSDEIKFNGTWNLDEIRTDLTVEEFMIQKANMQDKIDLFGMYSVGVWVTAHARNRLWDAIDHFDNKTVYCDTDSIKGKFTDEDLLWFDSYNAKIEAECEKCAQYHRINIDLYHPKTPKGVTKELGYFDREDDCIYFRTLGAKRYVDVIVDEGQQILCATIAGLPKKSGVDKLMKLGKGDCYKALSKFNANIQWNIHESGKLTAYYNDAQPEMIWVDRDGNRFKSHDKYGICLAPTSFDLGVTDEYTLFCQIISGSPDYSPWSDTKIFRNIY